MKIIIFFVLLLLPLRALADDAAKTGTLYKDPNCGCCEDYARYLRQNGFEIKIVPTEELPQLRAEQGVPEEMAGCHMTLLDGYVVEGHVPVAMIHRLLEERPGIKGISLPGMPMGSPGMGGEKTGPFTVLEIATENPHGDARVFGVD
ncbi:MAG TPA: DUF411 domain-containing protein [Alphaproteobacteria bacterium]|nr:DUF411 domain-containing protein [Alphaproteobacteria bacterium]